MSQVSLADETSLPYHSRMLTQDQLQTRMKAVGNLRAIARLAKLPEKTVYRTAHGQTDPQMRTLLRILDAVETLEAIKGGKRGRRPAPEPQREAA